MKEVFNDGYPTGKHTVWDCKYHMVLIPKYPKKVFYRNLSKCLGQVLRDLATQKECQIHEGHRLGDHGHIMTSIPPKYSVSQVAGPIKGQSATHIPRSYAVHNHGPTGQNFWAEAYCDSETGRDEELIGQSIKNQEKSDRMFDQMKLFNGCHLL